MHVSYCSDYQIMNDKSCLLACWWRTVMANETPSFQWVSVTSSVQSIVIHLDTPKIEWALRVYDRCFLICVIESTWRHDMKSKKTLHSVTAWLVPGTNPPRFPTVPSRKWNFTLSDGYKRGEKTMRFMFFDFRLFSYVDSFMQIKDYMSDSL